MLPKAMLSEDMNKIYDISIPITTDMPVWPEDPRVTLRQVSSIEKGDDVNISQIRMSVHTGTHIDAPRHFIPNGKTIDQIPLAKLTGEALVIEIDEGFPVITEPVLMAHSQFNDLLKTKKVLFKTSNSKLWGVIGKGFDPHYVGIDASGAQLLAGLDLDLIGVDYLSVAPFDDTDRPHRILLSKEIVLLEGINLTEIPPGRYDLYCLPLNIFGCEGAPARAILRT
jgi:arylformamidase